MPNGGENDGGKNVLGVSHSLSGRKWVSRLNDERLALAIAEQSGLPEIMGRLLAARGVLPEEVDDYLNPSLREHLPDPSTIQDMDKATTRLVDAIANDEKIAVFGDYDVDGATSSALLVRFFRMLGVDLRVYIPDRLSEGYGPNTAAMKTLADEGVRVVITVDCGTLSYEPLKAAKDMGLDVIVTDHHKAEIALPEACAVVNPNRIDDDSGLGQMAAVGVAFMLAVSMNRALRAQGFFEDRKAPDLLSLLDIVALGTVCDVVPLTGVNRVFVLQGLKVMATRKNLGLKALADVGKMDSAPNTYHLGFVMGPRVNAGGRVGEAWLGAELLSTEDEDRAREIAEHLNDLNAARREIEQTVQDEALAQIQSEVGIDGAPDTVVFAVGEGWHPGVIGIVASRLKDRYGLPTIVIGVDADGVGKGSARSIAGVDFGTAVIEAKHAGHISAGGGHAMAAGVTVDKSSLEAFKAYLMDVMKDDVVTSRLSARTSLDGLLSASGANAELVDLIEQAGPYGAGNPKPRFAFPELTLVHADRVGANHVRFAFKGGDGARLQGISFRTADEPLGQALLQGVGQKFHAAGSLKKDEWMGRLKVDLMLDDLAAVD
ncbi:MAG: single-stranded-DNA-specific exonuclease RecJ [Sphingomonadales bacterium]|nr:single-stranded-DNA-specific exonuclease RecJ [Sphingomonadales bacterium]